MTYIKETLCRIILLVDSRPSFMEKLSYLVNLIGAFAPVAYLLDGLSFWFKTNQQFSAFVLICLMINMGVGAWFHHKSGTFDFVEMLTKNALMWGVLILVYVMLEMLRVTAGNNVVGEGFKILIQVMTLLYPISKACKNIYILSNKQFPPAFIMDRMYNFEKNGNLKELFDTDKTT